MSLISDSVNLLGRFLGMRDIPALTKENLEEAFHIPQADVMVLFGGSILCGAEVLAKAMKDRVARTFILVGGHGHTTETLRLQIGRALPEVPASSLKDLSEAELFQAYLEHHFGVRADYLETRSTNCGNNITNLLDLLEEHQIPCESIILCQDATMQRRMDAGLRKHRPGMRIINYAAYQATVTEHQGRLELEEAIPGMWEMDRYVELLMGEIPRLQDDLNGYGPAGKGFIAHVDIPPEVLQAFESLKTRYHVRSANPAFATIAQSEYHVRSANPAFATEKQDEFEQEISRDGIGNMKGEMTAQLLKSGITDPIMLSGAEMDFPTAPCIRQRLAEFASKGLYGFTLPDEKYLFAIRWWMKQVRNTEIEKDWILLVLGTTFGLSGVVRALTRPGDEVLIQSPSYYRFDRAVLRNDRKILHNPLKEMEGGFRIDWEDLTEKLSRPSCRLMILVNPHNPTGKVFSQEDLEKISQLADNNRVTVFSDEIFAETAQPGFETKCYTAIDPKGISCTSLGKAFNFTGVNQANLIIPNPELREKIQVQRDRDHFGSIDPFFYQALCAAYTPEGAEWIRELNQHTKDIVRLMEEALRPCSSQIRLCPVEGTFIGWLDCRGLGLSDAELQTFFEKAGICGDPGIEYGPEGSGFYRWNLGTTKEKIQLALDRLMLSLQ